MRARRGRVRPSGHGSVTRGRAARRTTRACGRRRRARRPTPRDSRSTSARPYGLGASGCRGVPRGPRCVPASLTSMCTQPSRTSTSTATRSPGPVAACSTLLVTSSLTTSATSRAAAALRWLAERLEHRRPGLARRLGAAGDLERQGRDRLLVRHGHHCYGFRPRNPPGSHQPDPSARRWTVAMSSPPASEGTPHETPGDHQRDRRRRRPPRRDPRARVRPGRRGDGRRARAELAHPPLDVGRGRRARGGRRAARALARAVPTPA